MRRTRQMLMLAALLLSSGLAAAEDAVPPPAAVQPSPPNPGVDLNKRQAQCMMDADKRMQPELLSLMEVERQMPSDTMRLPVQRIRIWMIQYQDLLTEACQATAQTNFLEKTNAPADVIEAARQRSNEAHERKHAADRRIRDYAQWGGFNINF